MPYCLRTLDQQHAVELNQSSVNSIGSAPENSVPIQPEFGLAPRHFSISLGQGSPLLEDHTGGERTLINGQPVLSHSLRHGDIIRAGSLTLVFTGEESSGLRGLPPVPELPSGEYLRPVPKPPAPEGSRGTGPLPVPKPEPKVNSMCPATSALEFFQSGDAPLKHKNTGPIPRITGRVSLISPLAAPSRPADAGSDFFTKHTGSVPLPRVTGSQPKPKESKPKSVATAVPTPQRVGATPESQQKKSSGSPWLSMTFLTLLVVGAAAAFLYRERLVGSAAAEWLDRLPMVKEWVQGVASNR
jgi:hypothetical protein